MRAICSGLASSKFYLLASKVLLSKKKKRFDQKLTRVAARGNFKINSVYQAKGWVDEKRVEKIF